MPKQVEKKTNNKNNLGGVKRFGAIEQIESWTQMLPLKTFLDSVGVQNKVRRIDDVTDCLMKPDLFSFLKFVLS